MKILALLILVSMCYSCSVEPAPFLYGKDFCHSCKMTIMDRKFGGEVVTTKGKIYKFDDMNCMVNFLNAGLVEERDVAYRLVIDFSNPEKLVDAESSWYVKSDKIRSPMASEIAAFSAKKALDVENKQWNGILLSWGELITEFK